jgi:hypothetical protein
MGKEIASHVGRLPPRDPARARFEEPVAAFEVHACSSASDCAQGFVEALVLHCAKIAVFTTWRGGRCSGE